MNQSGENLAIRRGLGAALCSFILILAAGLPALAQTPATRHVRQEVLSGQAQYLNPLPAGRALRIDVVLPLRNEAGLDEFLRAAYDPSSPSYHRFLTVPEFTARFGASQEDYDAVVQYAAANGLRVVGGSRDGMDVQMEGSVADIERAFNVRMGVYQHPTENRTFYAPDREPTVPLPVALWHISGLDNYSVPRPALLQRNASVQSNTTTGSCPSKSYCGSDLRTAYYGGTLTGTGQSVGLLEFYGYDIADVNTYFANANQTNSVPIVGISTDGTSLTCLYSAGCDDTEQTIDITQAVSMAPGLSGLYMYVGSSDTAILSAMSTHSPLSAQLSSSWTWTPSDPATDDPFFKKFAAQGQSYFQAAGDSGAYTPTSTAVFPADDAFVTVVGGTDLVTSGPNGAWVSETVWVDGGGGYYTPDLIPIPSWQQLAGVITPSNEGSTTLRNSPDVAAEANFDFYVCADQAACSANEFGGTSFAAPMWAAYIALANQQSIANGNSTLGFINPVIYQLGLGSGAGTDFHDITSGNNGYSAGIGYDLATGWGSPNGSGLINALAGGSASFNVFASPTSITVIRGNNGTSTITTTVTDGFQSAIALSATGQPAGVTVTFNPSSIAAPGTGSSTMTIAVASTTAVGTYTITVIGTAGSSRDSISVILVVPPVVVSVNPPEATLIASQTQQFTATVMNSNNTAVTWALSTNAGTLSPTGLYTAPSTISTQQALTVTATSVADTTKTASATIILLPPTGWYNLAWTNRKTLTINSAQVSGSSNLVNFPVLVSLTDPNLMSAANGGSVANSNGNDVLFTASDGATKLNHEIESYNPATGQLIAWVQMPSVSPASDTVFYLYYGNPSASNQQNPAGVWDSNYTGVWHFPSSTALALQDSTSNGNNGSAVNGPTPVSGEIAGAVQLNGSSSYVNVGQFNETGDLTISAWVNTNYISHSANTDDQGIVGKSLWAGDASGDFVLKVRKTSVNNGIFFARVNGTSPTVNATSYNTSLATGTWYYVTATYAAASGTGTIYVNGASGASGSMGSQMSTNSHGVLIGMQEINLHEPFSGVIDEVRISSTPRSAAWIATEYNNQSSPSTFVMEGTQQNSGAVAAPVFSPAGGTYNSPQTVGISTATTGASIRYTLDGSTPSDTAGTLYSGPIAVSSALTLKAIAYESGLIDSAVTTAQYSFNGTNWYSGLWSDRKPITINHTQVAGASNLSNFPVLVSLTDANLATTANANGNDILFTASDGATKLNHEIESYNPSTGQLIAWVQVPTLSPTGDTVIFIYYGNPSASNQQNPAGVWDSNYAGVWHLANNSGTVSTSDSTGNANNGTLTAVATATGKIDGAGSSDGGHMDVANAASLQITGALTVEAWVNATAVTGNYYRLLSKFASGPYNGFELLLDSNTGRPYLQLANNGDLNVAYGTPLTAGAWYHVVGSYDGTNLAVYVNGAAGAPASAAGTLGSANSVLRLFDASWESAPMNGILDEVRVSNSARSAGWIATEYNNESSPSTFLSIGSQQGSTLPPPVAAPVFSPSAGNYTSVQTVTISTTTSGAAIRYTTDGSTPSETAGTLYTGPITVNASTTINAIAYESGLTDSAVTSGTFTITGSNWYSALWSDRKPISIHHAQVAGSSNLNNFPVLVSLTDANLATAANANGNDILFTASDGATKLNHEIESYNPSTGQLIAWVQVPTVSPTGDTVIFIYYGNASASNQQNPAGVWDSNYAGVWHLANNGGPVSVTDSTSNANNGTLTSVAAATGKIDGAGSSDGGHMDVANAASLQITGALTVEAWVNAAAVTGNYYRLLSKFASGPYNGYELLLDSNTGKPYLQLANNGDLNVAYGSALTAGAWYHVVGSYDGTHLVVYVNGAAGSLASAAGTLGNANSVLRLFDASWESAPLNGILDEVRVSSIARNAGWIATEYNNESSPSTFLSVGSQQGSWLPPPVAAPTFSPSAGTYASAQTVTISTATSGASIRYTTNGSAPSETSGTLYSGPITVSANATINAIAYASGMTDSAVASATYIISPIVATPTFSPSAGTYTSAQTVTISTTTSGASIRYTTDGSTPSETAGTLYSAPIAVSATTTINAIAYESGMTDSSVASGIYTISSSNTAHFVNADVTTQGSWKGVYGSNGYNVIEDVTSYPSYVTVTPSGQSNYIWSSSLSQARALQKAESPTDRIAATWYSGGSFSLDVNFTDGAVHQMAMYFLDWDGGRTQTVAIQDAVTHAVLDTRNLTSFYNGEYLIWNLAGHVKVIFTQTGAFNAVVSGLFFDPQTPVAAPTFSPIPGTYVPSPGVTINTATPGASIRYTTDGSTPSETAGTLYSGPITVSATTTINAIAYESGMTDSAVASATFTISGSNWYNASWSDRKPITISHAQVAGTSNLSNFPVLVSVTDANLATTANASGYDILFTASDGATKLNHEIESYNPSTGQLIAWVQVPTVSPTGDTVIFIYYGNSSASNQQNPAGVWDSNYAGVWHLANNGGTVSTSDSTGNANNGTLTSVAAATGKIDGAGSSDGGHMDVANAASLQITSGLTLEAWVNATAVTGNYYRLMSKFSTGPYNGFELLLDSNTGRPYLQLANNGDLNVAYGTALTAGTWYHVVASYDGTNLVVYVNGVAGTSAAAAATLGNANSVLRLFDASWESAPLNGILDEVRVSNSARSAGWIATEYNNESSPLTFLSVGSQQAAP